MSSRSSRIIFVGNLPGDTRESEIEDLFYKVDLFIRVLLSCSVSPDYHLSVQKQREPTGEFPLDFSILRHKSLVSLCSLLCSIYAHGLCKMVNSLCYFHSRHYIAVRKDRGNRLEASSSSPWLRLCGGG